MVSHGRACGTRIARAPPEACAAPRRIRRRDAPTTLLPSPSDYRPMPALDAYDAADLDAALDGAMGALCGDAAVDESRRTVTVSSIFKWYARDFRAAGADPLLPWLARFMPPPAAAAVGRMLGDGGAPPRLAYAPYDWDANSAGQGA
jgi:hypothetical protein